LKTTPRGAGRHYRSTHTHTHKQERTTKWGKKIKKYKKKQARGALKRRRKNIEAAAINVK
jgi:hypothetical protein